MLGSLDSGWAQVFSIPYSQPECQRRGIRDQPLPSFIGHDEK
jgi:hypothetical protein